MGVPFYLSHGYYVERFFLIAVYFSICGGKDIEILTMDDTKEVVDKVQTQSPLAGTIVEKFKFVLTGNLKSCMILNEANAYDRKTP